MKRVCLLTGASGALGASIIGRCAERYEIIAVHHRRPVYGATQHQVFVDPLEPTREVAANLPPLYAIRANISRRDSVDAVVAEVLDAFGRVDLLINAAAIRGFSSLLETGTDIVAESIMSVNVLAPLRISLGLAHALWREDIEANLKFNRNVINISSSAGLFVYPDLGQALYATSKAALNHLTYHLASELWDIGIRINALAPDTFPGRISTAEVVDAIIALDESADTGQVLPLYRP